MAMTTINLEFEITKQDVISGTKNYVCSQKYIERILKISTVNIIFHRLPIPEKFFDTKEFDSIPYRSFKSEFHGTGIAQLYRKWMKGFKDSFRKKYLKEFILYFTDDTKDIQEIFRFKFEYEENIAKGKGCSDLTDPTISILKNLILLGETPKLPLNIQMHVELFYKQDAPSDYQPPFFDSKDYSCTLKSMMDGQTSYESETLARICTGFHYFNCTFKRKSKDSQFLQDSERLQKRRKRKLFAEEGEADNIEEANGQTLKDKKSKWNISNSKLMQSMTSIDLTSNVSREGISFDVDYNEILDSEDMDIIAMTVTPEN